jgi:DNA-binding NarL/FixJ family response regulator
MRHEYTSKELDIIKFKKQGKSVREIAEIMDIGEGTVSAMLDKLKRKLNQ